MLVDLSTARQVSFERNLEMKLMPLQHHQGGSSSVHHHHHHHLARELASLSSSSSLPSFQSHWYNNIQSRAVYNRSLDHSHTNIQVSQSGRQADAARLPTLYPVSQS